MEAARMDIIFKWNGKEHAFPNDRIAWFKDPEKLLGYADAQSSDALFLNDAIAMRRITVQTFFKRGLFPAMKERGISSGCFSDNNSKRYTVQKLKSHIKALWTISDDVFVIFDMLEYNDKDKLSKRTLEIRLSPYMKFLYRHRNHYEELNDYIRMLNKLLKIFSYSKVKPRSEEPAKTENKVSATGGVLGTAATL
jgi:hypothetical protein